uniref:Serine carboxypeptidase n=1 Tax=Rhabditophanes sp. KR3021 TaxID=114890 RepID=A0AC35TQV8_9BILA
MKVFFCLLALATLANSALLPPYIFGRPTRSSFLKHHERIHFAKHNGIDALLMRDALEADAATPDVKIGWFTNQRFQYNDKFFDSKADPAHIFLMVGGEGEAEAVWVQNPNYQWMKMAAKHNAMAVQLEHRFFGNSQVFDNKTAMSFENLKYLTPKQAIEDLAAFIKGGSYPGGLTAVSRLKHPELSVGGIASSGGIDLRVDYSGYAQGMQDTILQQSKECYLAVNTSFYSLQQASLTVAGRNKLNKIFNLAPAFDASTTQLDITNFFASIFGVFQGIIQYTFDGRNKATENGLSVTGICKLMLTNNDPIQKLQDVNNWNNGFYNISKNDPFPNSYSDMINTMRTVEWKEDNNNALEARGWGWLTCNFLGFFQTTDQGRNIFQNIVPLGYFVNMCTDMFDKSVDMNYIVQANAQAKLYYGDVTTYNASNVVLPNGNDDPWRAIGVYVNNPATHTISMKIKGEGHCSDMYESYAAESPDLAGVRKLIFGEVDYYLGVQNHIETTTKSSSTSTLPIFSLFSAICIYLFI